MRHRRQDSIRVVADGQVRVLLGFLVGLRSQDSLSQDVSGLLGRIGNNPPAIYSVSDVVPETTSFQPALWNSQFTFIANYLGTRAEIVS